MAGSYNLGNLAQALRMSGTTDPALLAQLEQQQALEAGGAPSSSSAGGSSLNGALAALGSSYRVPDESSMRSSAPQPMPEQPPPAPQQQEPEPQQQPIGERAFDPRAGTRQLQAERAEGMNEALQLRGGDKLIQAEGQDRRAAKLGELGEERKQGLAAVRQRVDSNRAAYQQLEQQANQRLIELQMKVDNPPSQTKGQIMQIIGAVLSAGDGGQAAIGRGLQMLGGAMGNDVNRWMQDISANKAVHDQLLAAARGKQGDTEHELRVEDGLQDLATGVYSAALDQIAAETNSAEARHAARELKNGLRLQFVDNQLAQNVKAGQRGQRDNLYDMDMDLLAQKIAGGWGGKLAQDVYRDRAKGSQDVREGEQKLERGAAEIAKLKREAEGGAGQEITPGYVSTLELSPADRTSIHANAMSTADIISDLGKLRAIRERNEDGGSWDSDDMDEAQTIMGAMSTKLSQMNGAGAPSEGERELFRKMLTDPTGYYMRKDPITLYDRMARNFRDGFNSKLRAVGVMPRGGAGGTGLGYNPDQGRPKGGPGGSAPFAGGDVRPVGGRGPGGGL